MNGQMKRYKEIIKDMPEPIRLKDRPSIDFDMRGIMDYADGKGKKVIDLSEDEKNMFLKK